MIDEKGAYIQLILSSFGVLIYGIGLVLHVKSILILGVVCLLVAALFLLKVLYGTYKFKNTGVTK
jgi:Zn-dependent membrane protease YugP